MGNDLIQIGIEVKSNANQATAGLDSLTQQIIHTNKTSALLERQYKALDRAFNTNKMSAQTYAKAVQAIDRSMDRLNSSLADATLGINRTSKAMVQSTVAAKGASAAMNQYGKVSALGGKKMNRTNMIVQQSGYQFQDFAVQIQGGTNAFVALGQQGSQLLGVFGPAGAVLGAFLAVGTAIARFKTAGSDLAFDFKRFGADIAKSLEPLKPILSVIGSAVSSVGKALGFAANLIVNNLSKLLAIGLSAAAFFAGAWVVAFLKAGKILKIFNAGLVLLRANLLKTGIFAVIVLVGLLIEKFMRLTAFLGSVGQALTLLGAVATEIFGRMVDGVQYLYYKWQESSSSADVWIFSSLKEILGYFGDTFNKIGAFVVGTIQGIKAAFDVLPAFIGNIGKKASNIFVGGMEAIANSAIDTTNKLIESFNAVTKFLGATRAAQYFGFSGEIEIIKKADLSDYKKTINTEGAELSTAFSEGFAKGFDKSAEATPVVDFLNKAVANARSMEDVFKALSEDAAKSFIKPMPELKRLMDAIKKGSASVDELSTYFSLAKKEEKETTKGAKELADTLNKPLVSAIGSVSNAFGDFIARGLKDFKSFASSIVDSFKKMLSTMIATAVKNRIMISMGLGGSGFASGAGAAGTSAAFGGPMGSMLGTLGSGASMAGGTGLMGGMGNFAAGGYSMLTTGSGLAAGTAGAGTMATLGAAAAPLAAVALAIGFLSSKTKILDSGLKGTVTNMDATIESFEKLQKSRFFGLSKSVSTKGSLLSDEDAAPMIEAIKEIQMSVMDAAGQFGIANEVFDNFTHDFKLSLKGLSEEAKKAAIAEEFTKMGDAFAQMTEHFETMAEAIEAANQRMALQNRLDTLLGNNAAILARQREAEIKAVHELNKELLVSIHRLEDAQVAFAQADQAVGEAFKALRLAIDAEKKGITDAFTSLLDGLKIRLDAANEVMKRTQTIVNMLEGALSGRSVTQGLEQKFARREGALNFIRGGDFEDEQMLRDALSVVGEPTEQLFGSFVEYAREFGRTSLVLEQARGIAQFQLTAAEEAVIVLERQIEASEEANESQLAALDERYILAEKEYAALLGIDTSIMSVEAAIANLAVAMQAAIDALAAQRAAATAAAVVAATPAVQTPTTTSTTTETAEAQRRREMEFLNGSAAAAENKANDESQSRREMAELSARSDAIRDARAAASGEDNGSSGSSSFSQAVSSGWDKVSDFFGFATGGDHTGGLRMVGERGPELEATGPSRIFSNKDTAKMFSNPELVEEIRGLRSEVSGLRSEQRQMQASSSKYVKRNYEINRKWDVDGLPATRT